MSTSCAVVSLPRLKRTAVLATSGERPSAVSTWDGSVEPAEHADPEDTNTPRFSRSTSTVSPLTPGKQKLAFVANLFPPALESGPVSRAPGTRPRMPSMSRPRSATVRRTCSSRSASVRSRATASPTAPATVEVPDLRSRS